MGHATITIRIHFASIDVIPDCSLWLDLLDSSHNDSVMSLHSSPIVSVLHVHSYVATQQSLNTYWMSK